MDDTESNALDLARALLELDDREFTVATLTAYILATAAMLGEAPRSLLSRLADICPVDQEWFDVYLPDLAQE